MLPSGAVFFILIVAILLASALAWGVASLYRRRMTILMRGGRLPPINPVAESGPGRFSERSGCTSSTKEEPRADYDTNRRAMRRLTIALAGQSLLVALTQAALALVFIYDGQGFSLNRLLVLSLIYAWPMVLAWGLSRRWSWLRVLGAVALYMLVMLALVMARSTAAQTFASVSGWLLSQVAVPMSITLLIGASGRIRAVAPYLLPPTLLMIGASVLALQIMAQEAQQPAPWAIDLVETIGAYPTLLVVATGPWLILAWPIYKIGRWLADAYRRKRFSDLSYLIGTYWFLILFTSAVPAMESVGVVAFLEPLAWLWLPITQHWLRPYLNSSLERPGRPPTLLVLRVFQNDAQVERLFDQVIERWRLTGNTVLIAGSDLISRTLDPDDLFVYLNGSLAERFITSPAQVPERIAAFDWQVDPDGRYRINECYCHDTTWKSALDELVAYADVVLMDLRGFRAENQGCRYELRALSDACQAGRLSWAVILQDQHTDRSVAEAELHSDVRKHFHWLTTQHMSNAMASSVLASLLGPEH